MPMRYNKLFDLLKQRGMKKKDLLDVISEPTLAKLSKGDSVSTAILSAICAKLHCNVDDIMEYDYNESDSQKQNSKNRRYY